ncbi:hypothetical protein [Nocardia seriolae]|uniref:hypothetical protein n=1 Tax=Nocardia seriolae TaxID=37332 RepID=UPI0008F4C950|nr:hypothetical protein [Nocardia seriolae]OJF79115.1 hypothetical protein NS14008_07700 [Nocardia seriolae]WKY50868.1 hypothetical protein Q5P07_28390 [Nocardia seriolae]
MEVAFGFEVDAVPDRPENRVGVHRAKQSLRDFEVVVVVMRGHGGGGCGFELGEGGEAVGAFGYFGEPALGAGGE